MSVLVKLAARVVFTCRVVKAAVTGGRAGVFVLLLRQGQ